jgi:hypothetical protein
MKFASYARYRAAHGLLQTLWTKATGTAGYDKQEWEQLQAAIDEIARDGLGTPDAPAPASPAPVSIKEDEITVKIRVPDPETKN